MPDPLYAIHCDAYDAAKAAMFAILAGGEGE
jgi:hypothetical protein